jgi:hypothetical protein
MQTTNIGDENDAANLPQEFSETKATKTQLKGKPNSFQLTSLMGTRRFTPILLVTTFLLFIVCIFLGVRLSGNVAKVKALEEVTTKNSRQLANLNELLGRNLDANKEESGVLPFINLKLSLEFFKHLNELLASVDGLTFINLKSTTSIEKPNLVQPTLEKSNRSVNAEIRWWSSFFNQILIPLKGYVTDLVHVQVIDSPVSELAMSPISQTLIKKEVTIRLLTIRQLVLNGLAQEALIEIQTLQAITNKNFNLTDDSVKKFTANLDQLVIELEKIKVSIQSNQKSLKEN